MAHSYSRRQIIATGAATVGALAAASCSSNDTPDTGAAAGPVPEFWEPGPDKNLVRDLTPGNTTVRLGMGFDRKPGEAFGEAVRRFRARGYTGTAVGTAFVNGLSDSELREFNAALKQHDVVVFELVGYTHMNCPDAARRRENLKSLAAAVEAADKVNCPMVGTITGSADPAASINVHPDTWTRELWDITVAATKQVLRDTAGMKAALGIEAQITTNIDGPRAHRRLIDDVGDPRCAVNLDPVNMCSLANYYHTTELLTDCFGLLGESILGCHAKDTYIWPDTQTVHVQEVAAGRGVMDYETYLVRLSRLAWARTIMPEHVPMPELEEGAAYIRKVAASVGVTIHGG